MTQCKKFTRLSYISKLGLLPNNGAVKKKIDSRHHQSDDERTNLSLQIIGPLFIRYFFFTCFFFLLPFLPFIFFFQKKKWIYRQKSAINE
jgi:hypothetical protein